ncbi:MAG TPA: ATP synthase F1 subunit delta [Candidatus Binataceae bacterium]|nr:ATP synthase F1 subunit delta [Candidatus Binataceae bacterium]
MRGSKVAKRYARALLGLSEDRGQLEAWGAELERLARAAAAPEIAGLLAAPDITHQVRIEAMKKIAERLELSYPLQSLAVVVARHGRIAELRAISDSYQAQLDELMGRARATLTFARPPADHDVAAAVNGLEALARKKIIPTVKVDESLLGGVVAELEGRIYDGSLAARLDEAQRRLVG